MSAPEFVQKKHLQGNHVALEIHMAREECFSYFDQGDVHCYSKELLPLAQSPVVIFSSDDDSHDQAKGENEDELRRKEREEAARVRQELGKKLDLLFAQATEKKKSDRKKLGSKSRGGRGRVVGRPEGKRTVKPGDTTSSSRLSCRREKQRKRQRRRQVSSVAELSAARLSRNNLEAWVHTPFFAKTVTGCFVRVNVGQYKGRVVHRVAEIAEVVETAKVYVFGSTKTNKRVRLRSGYSERVFDMKFISNHPFTTREFEIWMDDMREGSMMAPTLGHIEAKKREISEALRHTYNEQDIDDILASREKIGLVPTRRALRKGKLLEKMEEAGGCGDYDLVQELRTELQQLEAEIEEKERRQLCSRGFSMINYINERNRRRNIVEAEQALAEEMVNTSSQHVIDPSVRLPSQPVCVGAARRKKLKRQQEEVVLKNHEQKGVTGDVGSSHAAQEARKACPRVFHIGVSASHQCHSGGISSDSNTVRTSVTSTQPSDLFSAHDFDIQLDIRSQTPSHPSLPEVVQPSSSPQAKETAPCPKRSFDLEEWKAMNGFL